MSKVYYDTEFLEGTQKKRFMGITYGETEPTIDLISIGLVSDDNRELYLISKEFNLWEAWYRHDPLKITSDAKKITRPVYWIRQNVLPSIFRDMVEQYHNDCDKMRRLGVVHHEKFVDKFTYKNLKWLLERYGKTRNEMAILVKHFVQSHGLEKNHPNKDNEKHELYGYFSGYDHVALCWLFGKMINLPLGFPMYTKDLKQMMDETKYLDIAKHTDSSFPKNNDAHNALEDARWNKKLHEYILNFNPLKSAENVKTL